MSKEELEDLALWLAFLAQARAGISMNGLTIRNSTILSISDSCPYGLGGFTSGGRAWRLKVSKSSFIYGKSIANNILEFLAMTINLWLALIECEEQGKTDELILALGDNTSAIGWIFKTSKLTKDSQYYTAANFIARKTANLLTKSKNILVAQHIPGKENEASDWMTFEGDDQSDEMKPVSHPIAYDRPSNDQFTERLLTVVPQLLPLHFKISHLPTELFSFAQESVHMLELSMLQNQRDTANTTRESGEGGSVSWQSVPLAQTPILEEYQQVKSPRSSKPFSKFIERLPSCPAEPFVVSVKNLWQE